MSATLAVWIGVGLNIAVTVGGVFLAYTAIRERLVRIETQLEPLWRAYERRRQTAGTSGQHP